MVVLAFALAGSSCSGDGGGGASSGGGAPPSYAFSSKPEGCGYTVNIDASRGSDFRADEPTLGADAKPKRVRLGLGGNTEVGASDYADPAKTVAIVWDSDVGSFASKVKIGKAPAALTDVHAGFSYLLPGDVPTRIHRADVCGLAPKTTYYYQVGGGPDGAEVWSEVLSFTTLASPAADAEVTIGVSGDSRDSVDVIWPLLQGRMAQMAPDFQLFTGDSILAALPTSENEYVLWFDGAASAKSLGAMPIFAIGGNHENVQAQWLANQALPGQGVTESLYASFDAGPVHVVVFDDQLVAEAAAVPDLTAAVGKTIADWVDADLAAADDRRDQVPWIVVANHRGILSTSHHADDADVLDLRKQMMPIYDAHHVDLVLNGHDHNYERSTPATGPADSPSAKTDPKDGTVYIVCAGAGADRYAKGTTSAPYRATNAEFGEGTEYVGLYGTLQITGKTLSWKAYGLKASGMTTADDGVVDEVSWSK